MPISPSERLVIQAGRIAEMQQRAELALEALLACANDLAGHCGIPDSYIPPTLDQLNVWHSSLRTASAELMEILKKGRK